VIVFDQRLGDLFVIRVARNIVAPSQVGSVEFAAERFGTRLVVVLGHSRCGAVLATMDALARPSGSQPTSLRSIVDRIRPSLEASAATGQFIDDDPLLRHAVRSIQHPSLSKPPLTRDLASSLVPSFPPSRSLPAPCWKGGSPAAGNCRQESAIMGPFRRHEGVFGRDLIEKWIELKSLEQETIEKRPHPWEFNLYYGC